METPHDEDVTRASIAARDLVATASGYLTTDVAMSLPFESLAPFKNLLKRFFSTEPWTPDDAGRLSDLVAPHIADDVWSHDLGGGIRLEHGMVDGRYVLHVSGGSTPAPSIFERAFSGPVVPEPTPHPRKVKFTIGGEPAPGLWFRRSDPTPPPDARVKRLFAEPDVTDVMVAGDFVTVGIAGTSSWERRLEPILALVTELFWQAGTSRSESGRTRDALIEEGLAVRVPVKAQELHLLDPDDRSSQLRLIEAQADPDMKARRIAVAVLAEARDDELRRAALERGYEDASRTVRRTAIDAAAGTEDPGSRPLFERALADPDEWVRWKAVRALGELGVEPSAALVSTLSEDPDFQVRFEVARVLGVPDEA